MIGFNENSLYLMLNTRPSQTQSKKEMPIKIWETKFVGDTKEFSFKKVTFSIDSHEAERISLDDAQ